MKSTKMGRTTGQVGLMSIFFSSLSINQKTYRKAFAVTLAQENEQGTNLKVRMNGLVMTLDNLFKLTAPKSVKLPR